MVSVRAQYEAYPYPERNPADETRRLIQGSPSHPLEMDHFLWDGARDWSQPIRALFAGGGTGDGLIQFAATLKAAGRPYDITYVDVSTAAREIATKRAEVRGLDGIKFLTDDLVVARDLGEFDYVDCCGVLHHLADPSMGFRSLSDALAPGGGLGFMVYAPFGRSGVYPLQEAFSKILDGLEPEERLRRAKTILGKIPKAHPFRQNPNLGDHLNSDAGFYDLLLHSQDRAFSVRDVIESLEAAGLELVGFSEPARYDLARFIAAPDVDEVSRMELAEKLDGTMKTHVGYAAKKGSGVRPCVGEGDNAVPHLKAVSPHALGAAVHKNGWVNVSSGGSSIRLEIRREVAAVLRRIDGHTSLGGIREALELDPVAFRSLWQPASNALTGWGLLWYSGLRGKT